MELSKYCRVCGFAPLIRDPNLPCVIKTLKLSLMEAKGFGGKQNSFFSLLNFQGIKYARSANVSCKSDSAFFGEEFTFPNLSDEHDSFEVDLCVRGKLKDRLLTHVKVDFNNLPSNQEDDKWLEMHSVDLQGPVCGSFRMKITLIEDKLLPSIDYDKFKDLLRSKASLPNMIYDLFREDVNAYARNVLTVWRRKEVKLLNELVSTVLNAEERPETLFRGNTLASKVSLIILKLR